MIFLIFSKKCRFKPKIAFLHLKLARFKIFFIVLCFKTML